MSILPSTSDNLLPIKEAAKFLKVSTKTLRRWEKQCLLIPQRTPGNQRRYTQDQLQSFAAPKPQLIQPLNTHLLQVESPPAPSAPKLNSRIYLISSLAILISALTSAIILVTPGRHLVTQVSKLPQELASKIFQAAVNYLPPPAPISQELPKLPDGSVLAAESSLTYPIFRVNVPAFFASTATVSGNLTAPNIVYGLSEGTGIDITGDPQSPIISVIDPLSEAEFFKTFKILQIYILIMYCYLRDQLEPEKRLVLKA